MPSVELLHAGLDRLSLALQGQPLTTPPLDPEVTADEVARIHQAIHGTSVDLAVVEHALRHAPEGSLPAVESAAEAAPVVTVRPTDQDLARAKGWALGMSGLTLAYMAGGLAYMHELVAIYPIHLALSMTLGMASGRLTRRWLDLKAKASAAA